MRRVLFIAAALLVATSTQAQPIPNHLADLQALRQEYPAQITQTQAGELLGRLAFRLKAEGFGLLRKDGGNRCPVNGVTVTVSCDWIVHMPSGRGCDVLGSGPDDQAPGPSIPSWCAGEPFDTSRFVAVTVDPGSGTPPPPPPPAGGLTKADVDAAIAKAVAQVRTDLWNEMQRALEEQRAVTDRQFAALPSGVNEDRVRQLIVEAFSNVVAAGSTGRTLGHSHSINVVLRPR